MPDIVQLVDQWMPGQLPRHFSATQATMAARCLEQYRQRYVWGRKEAPGGALALGGAFHSAQEHNFSQKVDSGRDVPSSEVVDAYLDAFDNFVDSAGGYTEVSWDDKPSTTKDKGADMAVAYHRGIAPSVHPVAAEQKFEIMLPRIPIPVIGYIDVETEHEVIDMKTAKSKPQNGVPKPSWRLQEGIYQAAREKSMSWHVITKTATPGLHTPATAPGLQTPFNKFGSQVMKSNLARIWQRIQWSFDTYGPDSPWEGAVTHDWACNYCGFRPDCPWWAR